MRRVAQAVKEGDLKWEGAIHNARGHELCDEGNFEEVSGRVCTAGCPVLQQPVSRVPPGIAEVSPRLRSQLSDV